MRKFTLRRITLLKGILSEKIQPGKTIGQSKIGSFGKDLAYHFFLGNCVLEKQLKNFKCQG